MKLLPQSSTGTSLLSHPSPDPNKSATELLQVLAAALPPFMAAHSLDLQRDPTSLVQQLAAVPGQGLLRHRSR